MIFLPIPCFDAIINGKIQHSMYIFLSIGSIFSHVFLSHLCVRYIRSYMYICASTNIYACASLNVYSSITCLINMQLIFMCQLPYIEPVMFELSKHVIPKVMDKWEDVAEAFLYDIQNITVIKDRERGDPKKCCKEFFKDWLQSNRGAEVGPKTWSTLLKVLEQVDIAEDILQEITTKVKQLKP